MKNEMIKIDETNIGDMIKGVADYFNSKIINGEFKFISCNDCLANVTIDDKYEFQLWIANDHKTNFDFYNSNFVFNSENKLLSFNTQKERMAGWKQLKPYVQAYEKKVLKKKKQMEINKLKAELKRFN